MKPFKMIPLAASALALGLGTAGTAQAGAYGVSFENVTNLTVLLNPVVPANTSTPRSEASAILNGAGVVTGGTGSTDAPPANAPGGTVTRLNNVFNQFGPGADQYANADSSIPFQQTAGNAFTQSIGIGEAELQSDGTGSANAIQSSLTGFGFTVDLPQGTVFTLNFDAVPFMRAQLDADAGPGSSVVSNISAVATLTDASGNTIFSWSPQGTAANDVIGNVGGTETADSFNLNTSVNASFAGDDAIFDPSGCGVNANAAPGCPNPIAFGMVSNPIAAGTYTFSLVGQVNTSLTLATVPEPGTLALLGLGLAGLGVGSRRKLGQRELG